MAATPLNGTVVHLTATGHVLAVVTSGALAPPLEDLTGGAHVLVRVPGYVESVNVPVSLLTASRVEITPDVLERPHWYVFGDGAVPLTLGPEPQYNVSIPTAGGGIGAAGKKFVIVWQAPSGPTGEDSVLDATGNLPATTPPTGATSKLVAWEGSALYVEPYP